MAVDAGGPSAEFFTNLFDSFFSDVAVDAGRCDGALAEAAGAPKGPTVTAWPLFQRGGGDGKLLPYLPPEAWCTPDWVTTEAAQEHLERFRVVGAALLKCILDGYALGAQLGRFLFDHLMSEQRPLQIADPDADGAFSSTAAALRALSDYDPRAACLASVVSRAAEGDALDLDDFIEIGLLPNTLTGTTRTISTVAQAEGLVMECAHHALLDSRRAALEALKEGFTLDGSLDLTLHLALFTPQEVRVLVSGYQHTPTPSTGPTSTSPTSTNPTSTGPTSTSQHQLQPKRQPYLHQPYPRQASKPTR